jgi:hypothetical protein
VKLLCPPCGSQFYCRQPVHLIFLSCGVRRCRIARALGFAFQPQPWLHEAGAVLPNSLHAGAPWKYSAMAVGVKFTSTACAPFRNYSNGVHHKAKSENTVNKHPGPEVKNSFLKKVSFPFT